MSFDSEFVMNIADCRHVIVWTRVSAEHKFWFGISLNSELVIVWTDVTLEHECWFDLSLDKEFVMNIFDCFLSIVWTRATA